MTTLTPTKCSVCEVELSGGLDTYGPFDAPVCAEHWFDPMSNNRLGELTKELLDNESEIIDIDDEIDELKRRKDDIDGEMKALYDEFEALGGTYPIKRPGFEIKNRIHH